MGLTKSMSSNHKHAIALVDKSLPIIEALMAEKNNLPEEAASISSEQRHSKILFKYWFKRANLLKRNSSFKESYETLQNLEARIRLHLDSVTDADPAAEQYLYKAVREQARICSLLKNISQEKRHEIKAWELFTKIYGKVQGWHQEAAEFKLDFLPEEGSESGELPAGMISMNMK